jgi:hypothetical protein
MQLEHLPGMFFQKISIVALASFCGGGIGRRQVFGGIVFTA